MTSIERYHEHHGCRLSYRMEGAGPPVLFIQGTGVHGAAWRPQIEVLSAAYSCLSFDNRGIGHSQPRGDRITIQQMASDALALIVLWRRGHVDPGAAVNIVEQRG